MTDEQLREAVARAICREKCAFMGEPPCFTVMDGSEFAFPPTTCCEPGCMAEADAAVALLRPVIRAETLEEAARVAEAKGDEWTKEWRAGLKCSSYLEGMSDGTDDVAVAIRALKEKPNG